MRKVRWTTGAILLFVLVLCPDRILAQSSYDYVITAGDEEIHFVSRPELGYVVVSQEETSAVEALDGTLRQFGAKDIRAVRGPGRRGVSVVFSQRPASENENTIKMLKAHRQIKYVAPLFSSNETTVAIIPEIVVRLREKSDDKQLQDLCQSINLRIKNKLQFTEREYLIEVPTADASGVFSAIEQLNRAAFIEWAVPNVAFQPQLLGQVEPNDTYFPNQWHLNNTGQSGGTPNADINAPEAWEITTGDPNIVVAVLDEGVDTDHPDLVNNIVAGYDFDDNDSDPNPTGDGAHGTACAGLIAAQGNNGMGVTGVAWHCKIMPIRIPFGEVPVIESDVATAIRWAANNGADVMSNSWGWPGEYSSPTIHSAVTDVTEQGGIGREGKGCVVLFASGNWESGGSVIYPAKYPEVIAVGATDHDDVIWYYSGSGPELDIVAPSGDMDLNGNIWTTDIAGAAGYNNRDPYILDYTDKMGGTSAACPIAAGVAALILSIEPNLINIDVQDILQISAVDLGAPGRDNYYGYGRVDASYALVLMWNYCTQAIDGDLDGDCRVDFFDYAIFANDWLIGSNLDDLATLSNNWLECNLAYQGACW
jgi:thermitase